MTAPQDRAPLSPLAERAIKDAVARTFLGLGLILGAWVSFPMTWWLAGISLLSAVIGLVIAAWRDRA